MEELIQKRIDNYNSEIELLNIKKSKTLYVKYIRLLNRDIRRFIALRDLEQDKLDKLRVDDIQS